MHIKRKYVHKTLREDVATKYGVPKNTLYTSVKSKEKIFAALEKGSYVKRQKLRTGDHETLGTAVFQMVFKFAKSNRPIIWCQYAKELRIENFKASDDWLRRGINHYPSDYVDGRRERTSPSKQYIWTNTSVDSARMHNTLGMRFSHKFNEITDWCRRK